MPQKTNRNTNIHGNVEKLTQIGEVKGDVIIQQGQDAEKLLKSGIQLVKVGVHKQAIDLLNQVIKASPLIPDAYYYLALALLRGKRPKLLSISTIKEIENHLRTVIHLQPQEGRAYVLWALIKYDFYILNGMYDRPPSYQDLLNENWSLNQPQAQEILSVINAEGNFVWQWLKNQL